MILTKAILAGYAGLVLWNTLEAWRAGHVLPTLSDVPLAVVVLTGALFLERDLAKGYAVIAVSAGVLSALSFVRLVRTELFFPHGYVWALGAMIGLLCFIKWMQLRGGEKR